MKTCFLHKLEQPSNALSYIVVTLSGKVILSIFEQSLKLKVTFNDGHEVCHTNVKQTFIDAINHAGAEKVRELGIMRNGCALVSINPHEEVKEYYRAGVLRDKLPNGMYVFCHMSTDAKANLLMDISAKLGNLFTVEYCSLETL